MPLFVCSNPQCDAVENTATSHYWLTLQQPEAERAPLCSACDPSFGKWHDLFPKTQANLEKIRQAREHFIWLPQRWRERLGEETTP